MAEPDGAGGGPTYSLGFQIQTPEVGAKLTEAHALEDDSLWKVAVANKAMGNKLVQESKHEEAVGKYSELIYQCRDIEKNAHGSGLVWAEGDKKRVRVLIATAYLNLSACFLHLGQNTHALNTATRALIGDEDPPNSAHDVLEPRQKGKAYFRRAMAREAHLTEARLADVEEGLKLDSGNAELRRLRETLKQKLKAAAKAQKGLVKGFLAGASLGTQADSALTESGPKSDAPASPDEAGESPTTVAVQEGLDIQAYPSTGDAETFDAVMDDLKNMSVDDPEAFQNVKEKLKKMCEDHDALPPAEWTA